MGRRSPQKLQRRARANGATDRFLIWGPSMPALQNVQHRQRIRRGLLAPITVAFAVASSGPTRAQAVVFDPSNYSQNVLTAARSLTQINNQIRSLENQALLLI